MRFLTFVLAFLALSFAHSADAKRVALVIGNSEYEHASRLVNPASDAQLISETLHAAGFETVDVAYDLGKMALERKLSDFSLKADGADVALVYFAGHGIEAGGQNYLIPVDARLERDRDLAIEATPLGTALSMVSGGQLKIVILDACRNNPFTSRMVRTFRNRSIGRGLAAIEPEGETLVVYAAKAGATAADGDGVNSPFAQALAERLPERGLEISLLFRRVRDDVLQKTGGSQEPFTYGSLSGEAFYFVPAESRTATTTSDLVTAPSITAETSEALFWQGTVNANTEGAYRAYLNEYPTGRFAALAQENITRITAPPATLPGTSLSFASFQNVIGAGQNTPAGQIKTDDDVLRQFAFEPDPAIREQAKDQVIAQMSEGNAEMGEALTFLFKEQDVFALMQNDGFKKYGMSTDNFADVMSTFIYALHDIANGEITDARVEQAHGLRNQVAKLLILSPGQLPEDPGKRQEMSDVLFLSAIALIVSFEASKADPAIMQQVSDTLHQQALQMMSVDLRSLEITGQGLTPRSAAVPQTAAAEND
ncbi:MAG: caspase family protein [Pseudomonadota bacterium]